MNQYGLGTYNCRDRSAPITLGKARSPDAVSKEILWCIYSVEIEEEQWGNTSRLRRPARQWTSVFCESSRYRQIC